jgi:hypothetical protein
MNHGVAPLWFYENIIDGRDLIPNNLSTIIPAGNSTERDSHLGRTDLVERGHTLGALTSGKNIEQHILIQVRQRSPKATPELLR